MLTWFDSIRENPTLFSFNFSTQFFILFTDSPAQIKFNGSNAASVYLSSSPPKFCPPGRTDDLSAIIRVIDSATKFVFVSVMDYFPTTLYTRQRT